MKLKEKIFISILLLITIAIIPVYSRAALQANGNRDEYGEYEVKTDTLDGWILNVRKMETTGGTLGLTDTINTSNLTSSASSSNNLDIHMQKNTEYGAMAILSASAYGNQAKIEDGETTTGNKSGIYINFNSEWVAAGAGLLETTYAKNASVKYINNDYTTTPGEKYHTGDAMDIGYWHEGYGLKWFGDDSNAGLVRDYDGSLFSYFGRHIWQSLWL